MADTETIKSIYVCLIPDLTDNVVERRSPHAIFFFSDGTKKVHHLANTGTEQLLAFLSTLTEVEKRGRDTRPIIDTRAGRHTNNPWHEFDRGGSAASFASLLSFGETELSFDGKAYAFESVDGQVKFHVPVNGDVAEFLDDCRKVWTASKSIRKCFGWRSASRTWASLNRTFDLFEGKPMSPYPDWRLLVEPLKSYPSNAKTAPDPIRNAPYELMKSGLERARINIKSLRKLTVTWSSGFVAVAVLASSPAWIHPAPAHLPQGPGRLMPPTSNRKAITGWTSETHRDKLIGWAQDFDRTLDQADDRVSLGVDFSSVAAIETHDAYQVLAEMLTEPLAHRHGPSLWAASNDLQVYSLEGIVHDNGSLTTTGNARFIIYDSEPMVFLVRHGLHNQELLDALRGTNPLDTVMRINEEWMKGSPSKGIKPHSAPKYRFSCPDYWVAGCGSLVLEFIMENWALHEGIAKGSAIPAALNAKGCASFKAYLHKLTRYGYDPHYPGYDHTGTVAFMTRFANRTFDYDFAMLYQDKAKDAIALMKKNDSRADAVFFPPSDRIETYARFCGVVLGKAFGSTPQDQSAGEKFVAYLRNAVGDHMQPLGEMELSDGNALTKALSCAEEELNGGVRLKRSMASSRPIGGGHGTDGN